MEKALTRVLAFMSELSQTLPTVAAEKNAVICPYN